MTTNYADDAGLTSANPLSNGGELEVFGPSPADDSIVKMGKPPYINCCPTGTVEFVAGSEEDCCGAVEATVAALQTRIRCTLPRFWCCKGVCEKTVFRENWQLKSEEFSPVTVQMPRSLIQQTSPSFAQMWTKPQR